MEEFQKAYGSVMATAQQSTAKLGSWASFVEKAKSTNSSSSGFRSSAADTSGVLITRPPRQAVSIGTCSKLCVFFFIAGIFAGYTLKKRVNRWVSKLLRRLKDD